MTDSVKRIVTLGECMGLLSARQIGLLENAGDLSVGIGGAEANVCIAAVRLGIAATWIGRLGTDRMGDLIERRLRANGVATAIRRDPGFTGLMICTRRTSTSVEVDYHRRGSAGSRLAPADLGSHLDNADLLHVTGITPALSGSAQAAVLAAIDIAGDRAMPVAFDVNYRAKLWSPEIAAPLLRTIADRADIVFAGIEEAQIVLGTAESDPAMLAPALADLGPRDVVIKLGAAGCFALIDGTTYSVPAAPTMLLDPVGAGDAFVAGYLVERVTGRAAHQCLNTAVRMGAAAVSVPGDCENLPYRDELDRMQSPSDVIR